MKSMKKTITALTLTGMMTAGFGMSAFAADSVPVLSGQEVTKHFEMAEGLEIPDTEFLFTATAITADAPDAVIDRISYNSSDALGILSSGNIYTVDKSAEIRFGTFPHAGVYEYTVNETKGNADGVTYDSTTYTMRVYVQNDDSGDLSIRNITAEAEGVKETSLAFTNTYRKDGSLTITKNTVGELADKTKDFEFILTFYRSGTESDDVTSYTGQIGNDDVECAIGKATTFYLHDGETLEFTNLPVGTRYIVTEAGKADGYSPSVRVIENGANTTDSSAADSASLSTAGNDSNNLVGEKENSVIFTNTYDDVPATGLFLRKLPFLLLICIPGLALILPALAKFRRKKRGSH